MKLPILVCAENYKIKYDDDNDDDDDDLFSLLYRTKN